MKKQEQEALERLEKALMELEEDDEVETQDPNFPQIDPDILEYTWTETAQIPVDAYSTDDTDVDLDTYSEEVYQGSKHSILPGILTVLVMLMLGGCILFMLKQLGVLG